MKHITSFSLLVALLLTISWASSSETISKDLSSGIVRLHILANSNSDQDQSLKLKIRDRLLTETKKSPVQLTDDEILAFCKDEIAKNGCSYNVSIERGRFSFPRKSYDNLTLPAGNYNAVRIILGAGGGENWWCVMYPPLCFAGESIGTLDAEALSVLRQSIRPESYAMICESDVITVKPSFKLVELWNELKARFDS